MLDSDLSCLPSDRGGCCEIFEDIHPDEPVLAAVQRLASEGYTLALDDFVCCQELEPLVRLADIVKIEFPAISREALPMHVSRLRELGVQMILAEKLETHEEFEYCKQLGCDLFQGYFFCRPRILNQRKLPNSLGSVIRLVTQLQVPAITMEEVERVIQTDASLAFKILRYVNSVEANTNADIESIRHAAALLGLRRLRSIASMMLLASLDRDKPNELVETGMTRGRMCELLAIRGGYEAPERFFTIGLLSVLDAMLDLPMSDVVTQLPLTQEMNAALLTNQGQLGLVLRQVLDFERATEYLSANDEIAAVYWEVLQSSPN